MFELVLDPQSSSGTSSSLIPRRILKISLEREMKMPQSEGYLGNSTLLLPGEGSGMINTIM